MTYAELREERLHRYILSRPLFWDKTSGRRMKVSNLLMLYLVLILLQLEEYLESFTLYLSPVLLLHFLIFAQ